MDLQSRPFTVVWVAFTESELMGVYQPTAAHCDTCGELIIAGIPHTPKCPPVISIGSTRQNQISPTLVEKNRELQSECDKLRTVMRDVVHLLNHPGDGLDVQTACENWSGTSSCRDRHDQLMCDGCVAAWQIETATKQIEDALGEAVDQHDDCDVCGCDLATKRKVT